MSNYLLRVSDKSSHRFTIGKVYHVTTSRPSYLKESRDSIVDDNGDQYLPTSKEECWLPIPHDQFELANLIYAQHRAAKHAAPFYKIAKDRLAVIKKEIEFGLLSYITQLLNDSCQQGVISINQRRAIASKVSARCQYAIIGNDCEFANVLFDDHKTAYNKTASFAGKPYEDLQKEMSDEFLSIKKACPAFFNQSNQPQEERNMTMIKKLQPEAGKLSVKQQWQINGQDASEHSDESLLNLAVQERERREYLKSLAFGDSRAVAAQIAYHEANVTNLLQLMEDRIPVEPGVTLPVFVIGKIDAASEAIVKRFTNKKLAGDEPDNFPEDEPGKTSEPPVEEQKKILASEIRATAEASFVLAHGSPPTDEVSLVEYRLNMEYFTTGMIEGVRLYSNSKVILD